MIRAATFGLLLAPIILAGCSKPGSSVKDEKTLDVGIQTPVRYVEVPAVKKVSVEFSSTGSVPVSVYICSIADAKAAEDKSDPPKSSFAKVDNAQNGTVSHELSSKQECAIVVYSRKTTKVTLKISGS
jgi:hypothetical protein